MVNDDGVGEQAPAPRPQHGQFRANAEVLGAGFVLGAMLVGGYAVADALEHTHIHEEIGGVETSEGFRNGVTSVSVFGHTVYLDKTKQFGPYKVGMQLSANTLPTDLATLVRPASLEAFSTISDDPEKAAEGYQSALTHAFVDELKHRGIPLEVGAGLAGSLMLWRRRKYRELKDENQQLKQSLVSLEKQSGIESSDIVENSPQGHRATDGEVRATHRARGIARKVGAVVLTIGLSAGIGSYKWHHSGEPVPDANGRHLVEGLEGTGLEGAFTLSDKDVKAVKSAIRFVKLQVAEQMEAARKFELHAETSLRGAYDAIEGPQAGETAFLVGSDMHSNLAMIHIATETVSLINQKFGDGTIAFVLFAGDNTYGQAAEKDAVDKMGKIGGGAPEATGNGNHDSKITDEQLKDAHIEVLNGKLTKIAGVPVVGMGDPNLTELFGPTISRDGGKTSEFDAGNELYEELLRAKGSMPVAETHEAYAAGAALGLGEITHESITQWFNDRGSNTVPWEDGVRDLPASLLIYGHWHRIIKPRTVWNSDGTWSVVMELNTMGGAIANTSPTHFSTPVGPPGQTASFPVIFRNNKRGLMTGYQMYTFDTDGQMHISKRIRIGSIDGQPYTTESPVEAATHRRPASADHKPIDR
jgi:hypothetical protein